jgi:hypothetical protein
MNKRSKDLVDFLGLLKQQNKIITDSLGSNPDGVYVYYIAPLSNISHIFSSGGIQSRNDARHYIDLSYSNVQKRRTRKITLACGNQTICVPIHNCIPFFLNPFNSTYFLFRRNALVQKEPSDNFSRIVGIIELDLSMILANDDTFWGISNLSLAKNNSYVTSDIEIYSKYSWTDIYRIQQGQTYRETNDLVSAEWITCPLNNLEKFISSKSITRVLVYNNDLQRFLNSIPSNLVSVLSPFTTSHQYMVCGNPLKSDMQWLLQLERLEQSGIHCELVLRALKRLLNLETEIGMKLAYSFKNSQIARGSMHGIGHTIRVMFWILFLVSVTNSRKQCFSDKEETTALYAGFFHDLYRDNNEVEPTHGNIASSYYSKVVHKLLPGDFAIRCLNAISVHSLTDDPKEPDVVWQLLKDADALDRGRFGFPRTLNGCNPNKLRLSILRTDIGLCETICWSAFSLSKITRSVNWGQNACAEFVNAIIASLTAVFRYELLDSNQINIVSKIIAQFRSCQFE